MATIKERGTGLVGDLAKNPATSRLADEAKQLLVASGGRIVDRMGDRVASTTGKLDKIAENGGNLGPLAEGAKRIAQGDSPVKAAMGGVMANIKQKVKGLFGKGKGGGGRTKVMNIQESVDIGVPVSTAYDQWTQFQDFSRFMKGVESVEQTSETESNWRAKVFKSRRTWKANIIEQIPDRRIAWSSEGAKGSTKGVVTFHPLADDLTRVLISLEYYPHGLMEKTGNIWRAPGRRARLDIKNYRRFIMAEGEATGSWRGEIRDGQVVGQPDEEGEEGEDRSQDDAREQDSERQQEQSRRGEQGERDEPDEQTDETDEQPDDADEQSDESDDADEQSDESDESDESDDADEQSDESDESDDADEQRDESDESDEDEETDQAEDDSAEYEDDVEDSDEGDGESARRSEPSQSRDDRSRGSGGRRQAGRSGQRPSERGRERQPASR